MSVGPRREPSGSERAGLAGPPRRDLRPHPRSCGGASDLSVFCSVTRLRRPRALGCEAPFVWPPPSLSVSPSPRLSLSPARRKRATRTFDLGSRAPRQSLGPSTPLGARSPPSLQDERLAPTLPTPRALPPGCPRREPRLRSQGWLRAALHAQGHTRHAPCPCGGHWPRAPVPPYGPEVRAQSGPHGGRTKRPGLAPAGGLRGALPAPPSRARPPARPVPSPPRDAPTTPGTGSVSGRRTRRLSSFGGFSSPLLGNVTATGPRV